MFYLGQENVESCWQMLDLVVKGSFRNATVERDTLPMDINWPMYMKLQAERALILVCARGGGRIVGFVSYLLSHNLHHQTLFCAHCDFLVTHVDSQGKGVGKKLIEFSEQILQQRDVKIVTHNFRTLYDIEPLFPKLGYELDEQCYRKML